jgi:hypothetical protein
MQMRYKVCAKIHSESPEAPMTFMPSAQDWLPRMRLGKRLFRTSIDVGGLTMAELSVYLDDAIAVCRERGFDLREIGLPGPALHALSDQPLGPLGLMGQYRGMALYVHYDYPLASFLELAFNGDESPQERIS